MHTRLSHVHKIFYNNNCCQLQVLQKKMENLINMCLSICFKCLTSFHSDHEEKIIAGRLEDQIYHQGYRCQW